MPTLLAFDTATERTSIGLLERERVWLRDAAGGAQASAALVPAIESLMAEAGVALRDLDAIAFGRGPGAFTGLRTACAVAQGMALGAGKPVLPVDTLLAVAEDARDGDAPQRIWAVTDARMNEAYAAHYAFERGLWSTLVPPFLATPQALNARWRADEPAVVAGSALTAFEDALDSGGARRVPAAAPRAGAMLAIAQALWAQGAAVDPALALPLYVRDKVAQTTVERDAARAAKDSAAEGAR